MVVALAGAPFEAWLQTVGGARSAVAPWQALRVQDGDRLTIGGAQQGARAYLCVAGGIDVPPHHDSRATHLGAGLGGLAGRALRENDRLPVGTPRQGLEVTARQRLTQRSKKHIHAFLCQLSDITKFLKIKYLSKTKSH